MQNELADVSPRAHSDTSVFGALGLFQEQVKCHTFFRYIIWS
jgi:hypothetical protein